MRILVIKPSSLGDVIHGLRVVQQIHANLPDMCIDWVIKEDLEPILIATGFINKCYLFKRAKGVRSYLSLAKDIRGTEYDYVLDLQGLMRSSFLASISRSDFKYGVADGREFSTFLYSPVGEKSRKAEIHAIDRLLPFLSTLGIDKWDHKLPLQFPNSVLQNSNCELLGEDKFILLFPESRRSEKVWPHFRELNQMITKSSNLRAIIGGNNSIGTFPGSVDLRGKLSLTELPEVVRRASVVVSNDSAPLHIASALSKPLVSLFGPTTPKRYGPYPVLSKTNRVLYAGNRKIDSIPAELVFEAIQQLAQK